jgi:hypothetical protein
MPSASRFFCYLMNGIPLVVDFDAVLMPLLIWDFVDAALACPLRTSEGP